MDSEFFEEAAWKNNNPAVLMHHLLEMAMPSEPHRETLLAWFRRIADPEPERDKPMALVGRGAAAFARYHVWMMQNEGFRAQVLPWRVVQSEQLSVPNLHLTVFVGDHGAPVNRDAWKALCARTRILIGCREHPGVSPLGAALPFELSSRAAAGLTHHVDEFEGKP